jgi:pimeloyl-ACP methyl ester carboxylesterase
MKQCTVSNCMISTLLLISDFLSVDSLGAFAFQFPGKTSPFSDNAASFGDAELLVSDIPLVFVPGIKGSHLSFFDEDTDAGLFDARGIRSKGRRPTKRRAWLTLGGLLNIPSIPNEHRSRNLSLPLTYNSKGIQDRGHLFADGVVEHIIQIGENKEGDSTPALELFPFYGHVTKDLEEMNARFKMVRDENTSQEKDEIRFGETQSTSTCSHHCRPTAVFPYDWRRSISENSNEFHRFCEEKFPGTPVQVCGHSMGGLICYTAMRKYPGKYKPGGVFVGVPFGTGIQYLQDIHKGYYTEIQRCQQFTPKDQFSFSSHWLFFPTNQDEIESSFVDVSEDPYVQFRAGEKDSTAKASNDKLQPAVRGEEIKMDFYDVNDWEQHKLGIFHPKHRKHLSEKTIGQFRNHLTIQFAEAKEWRKIILGNLTETELDTFPQLVLCATDTLPTVNQILRREKKRDDTGIHVNIIGANQYDHDSGAHEYDYTSGRSVPGDGRIDFDKAFPDNVPHKKVHLSSKHSKQMCRQAEGK